MRLTCKEIYLYIEKMLNSYGHNAADMCASTGLTKAVISKWKGNSIRYPRLDTLIKICNYFDITLDTLIDFKKEKRVFTDTEETMIKMITELNNEDKDMVASIIRTYYEKEVQKKVVNKSIG